jgi:hypothetical protein
MDGPSRLCNYLSSSETELRFMEDLTLKITVEYSIRSENENNDFDQRGFPSTEAAPSFEGIQIELKIVWMTPRGMWSDGLHLAVCLTKDWLWSVI